MRTVRLIHNVTPGTGVLDVALSHAVLREVAAKRSPETLRIYRPDRVVAFGRRDVASSRYGLAVEAARAHGYVPIERLAGGRAAVFHPETIAFAWAIPSLDPKKGITSRFETVSAIMRDAFQSLGADARIGELAGEYCPGRYSVNVAGHHKVMGVGQRLIPGAAHVGGVVVVGDSSDTRDILTAIYEALTLDWAPETAGALTDTITTAWRAVVDAVISGFTELATLESGGFTAEERSGALGLVPSHIPSVPTG